MFVCFCICLCMCVLVCVCGKHLLFHRTFLLYGIVWYHLHQSLTIFSVHATMDWKYDQHQIKNGANTVNAAL